MKQIVIKKWIDGEFCEVKRYSEEEVVSIRHHTDGLEVILKGNIRLYDTQCIIEFEEECDDNIGNHLLNWFKDCNWDSVDNGTLKRDDIIAWIEKRIEKYSWSEEDKERMRNAFIEKACEWLKKNVTYMHPRKGTEECVVNLNAFIESMKGE